MGDTAEFDHLVDIFERARSAPPRERRAVIAQACGGDTRLLSEVLGMFEHFQEDDPFLEPRRGAAAGTPTGSSTTEPYDEPVRSSSTEERMARLRARPPQAHERYHVERKVAQGAMGAIFSVRDDDLRRRLAMKVILSERDERGAGDSSEIEPRLVERFLDEAQVTGQLDHPGVVPVHDLGLDQHGRVFFTMRLVRGRTVDAVFEDARAGRGGWTTTKALEVILKICDTMAFAHAKGVLHRDLKPSNVMVGRYGEVYVMDWGLAKIMGEQDRRDLRIRPASSASLSRVLTDRAADVEPDSTSALLTMDGAVVGTPSYMPPEQAQGKLDELGSRSDVYAVGAMLYTLLTGWRPYVKPGARVSGYTVLRWVLDGPPKPVHEIDGSVPAELVAICEKAMARDARDRYANMGALADDVRAYLEQRVVEAYRTGALAEMRMWVRRNKPLAASLAAAFAIAVVGAVVAAAFAREADAKVREFNQMAGFTRLETALDREKELYPAWPEQIPAMGRWLDGVKREVLPLVPQLEQTVLGLRARALPADARQTELGSFDPAYSTVHQLWFPDGPQRFLHDSLAELQHRIEEFEVREMRGVEQRKRWAERIRELTERHPKARRSWLDARDAIAKSPLYPTDPPTDLQPQLGLVPIGPNPVTGLWEFYHLWSAWDPASGMDPADIEIPVHGDQGKIEVMENTGIVFVLLPGGTYWMGSQKKDPTGPNYDPDSQDDEVLHQETVGACFVGRHELTQGQWLRLCSEVITDVAKPGEIEGFRVSPTLPIGNIRSGEVAVSILARHALRLPTEAEWEYACRAGTSTVWWTGDDVMSLFTKANVLDKSGHDKVPGWGTPAPYDDKFWERSPVGHWTANRFGLHDTHGNVWEWCQGDESLTQRGGSFAVTPIGTRSANRWSVEPMTRGSDLGVRPVRSLMPAQDR